MDEFIQSPELVAALRKGVTSMKARKPSDPLSWFFQAAIHGVTDEKIQQAAKDDPDVSLVDAKKYWNQCPHFGQTSANFLPWHRGYTYFFERILRMHTERDDFALPYWNYTDKTNDRRFPEIYGIQYLDGNLQNEDPSNINPLWEAERDFYFTTYQHPLTDKVPLLSLSDDAVDIAQPMATPVFFGETEREGLGGGIADDSPGTRGLLESYPHDQIHRAVGGIIGSHAGAMAVPPTAGFDPIFSVHHTNIDWLWVQWSCMPGKSWGKLPPADWFNERPWFFFDEKGHESNEPRRHFFDHRALGIRFKYEDMSCSPLELPQLVVAGETAPLNALELPVPFQQSNVRIVATPVIPTKVPLGTSLQSVQSALSSDVARSQATVPQARRVLMRFADIEAGTMPTVGFDVHLTTTPGSSLTRHDSSFVGSVNLFNHPHHPGMPVSQEFDVSRAVSQKGGSDPAAMTLVFVPYPLFKTTDTGSAHLHSQPLSVRGVEFRLAP